MKYAFLLGVSLILAFPGFGLGAYAEPAPDSSWGVTPLGAADLLAFAPLFEQIDLAAICEDCESIQVLAVYDLAQVTGPVHIIGLCGDLECARVIMDVLVPGNIEGLDELREKVALIDQAQQPLSFTGKELLEDIINLCLCPAAQCQPCCTECICYIPEPATVVMLGLGGLLMFRRRTF